MTFDVNGLGGDEKNENPLQIFVSAKRDINGIFTKAEKLVHNVHEFYRSYDGADFFNVKPQLAQLEASNGKIAGIKDVLARNNMKVAFFGRTSNGKSTVINAILQNRILPAGIGHTTNCFLQVEGTDENEPYIVVNDQRRTIESVKNLGNALSQDSLEDSALVKIYWPKSMCPILHDDVVLVDSPGTDVSANLDKWIDLYCRDADVFILVSNAESTLMQTEKNFFIKVKEKLSKPNIFILNNRWDASAQEPESLDLVRNQHMTRDVDFLVNDLAVVDETEAKDRVFFVSAREVLNTRIDTNNGQVVNKVNYADGFENRFTEFVDFEKKFEQCLSKAAVQTKFRQHTQEMVNITSEMRTLLEDITTKTRALQNAKMTRIKQIRDSCNFTKQQFQIFTNEVKLQICHLVKQVEQKVSTALNEEIRRLSVLVADFEKSFNTDPQALAAYKKELNSFVEQGLGLNLKGRLSSALTLNVESTQQQMIAGVKKFIPANVNIDKMIDFGVSSQEAFKLIYRLNCDSLCGDFEEDLEFRFSYGFMQLIAYFTGGGNANAGGKALANQSAEQSMISFASDKLDVIDKLSNSRTTISALAVGGCLVRVIGWHVIAITTVIYVVLYVYERMAWTTRAKETAFKKQYVAHATKKLRLIIDLTSANCSHQVQQ